MTKRTQCQRCAKWFTDDQEGALHKAGCRVYNGWTNYETWAVALWLDNVENSYRYWREVAEECKADAEDNERTADGLLADRLKSEHEDAAADRLGDRADIFTDLLNGALSDVDWYAIAENILSES